MKKYFLNMDFTGGLVFSLFAIFYLAISSVVPVSDVVSVGAGFTPRIYGGLLFGVSILLLVRSAYKIRKKEESVIAVQTLATDKGSWSRILITFLLIVFYSITLTTIGFIIDSTILVFALCILLTPGYKKPNYISYLVFAFIMSVITDVLFAKGLSLLLPQGLTSFL